MVDRNGPAHTLTATSVGNAASSIVFLLVFCYFWITLTPLADLSPSSAAAPTGENSNAFNQIVVLFVAGAVLSVVVLRQSWELLLNPRFLLLMLFCWLFVTSLVGDDPVSSLRRVVFSGLVLICANAFLLLTRSNRHFSLLLGWGVSLALLLAFFGVVFLPGLAIHQASDSVEAVLAGDWRGHFGHKNVASAAMVLGVFIGLYVGSISSKTWGRMIVLASGTFLIFTGGKTALAMLPAVLVLAFIFEKLPVSRVFVTIGGVVVMNFLVLGAAVNDGISSWISGLGVDATFTGRTDIWRFTFEKVAESPILGKGFQAFWQTNSLRYGGGDIETWAVAAAHSHNSYLEMIINAGIPGLALMLILFVILPINHASRALKGPNDKNLTRLFLRIWLFCIYLACLESFFFANTGPLWFTMLVAVFGLRLQGCAGLVGAPKKMSRGFARYYVQ